MLKPVETGFFVIGSAKMFADVLIVLFVLCALMVIWALLKVGQLKQTIFVIKSKLEASEILHNDFKSAIYEDVEKIKAQLGDSESKLLESDQVTRQLEHRIKSLKIELEQLRQDIIILNEQQPEDKLYSRALKLVKLGASVDEIISECEIPKAEAEMLVSVHKSNTDG